jgi:hypothetical protein
VTVTESVNIELPKLEEMPAEKEMDILIDSVVWVGVHEVATISVILLLWVSMYLEGEYRRLGFTAITWMLTTVVVLPPLLEAVTV